MRLLAIDGNSIMNRAFYGIRALSNKKGVYTNALLGFMNIFFKNHDEIKPDCVAVAFDLKAPTFRHRSVATYKANRKGMPEELAMQMPLIKKLLTAMGIKIVECEGYEADDILGTLSRICGGNDECYILTGDRDSLQLINENVTVLLATNKETVHYTTDRFLEEYHFMPINLIDLKALMGDSSDNIAGVAGIGAKTANPLIEKWGTIENLYEHIDEAGLSKGAYNKMLAGRESAKQSKWLATILTDIPIDKDIRSYIPGERNDEELSRLLTELEMIKLLTKLKLSPAALPEEEDTGEKPQPVELNLITENADADTVKKLTQSEEPLYTVFKDGTLFVCTRKENDARVFRTENKELILDILSNTRNRITFGAKSEYHYLLENGREIKRCAFDCEIGGYLLDPSAKEYTIELLCNKNSTPYQDMGEWSDIVSLSILYQTMHEKIKSRDLEYIMYEVELPLTEVLASMEHTGVLVDAQGVRSFGEKLKTEVEKIQQEIYNMCGQEFNILSPKQLGEILPQIGVPLKKKTKTGFSTSADVLEEFRAEYPVIDKILTYRQLTKLASTYVEGLLKTISTDGRIHTNFKQTETRTGRISSTEPNMQNIPVRTELGREMRKFFAAPAGKTLLDADYSQIELRIVAHICSDPVMIQGFQSGTDIHRKTAAQVFNMPEEMVTSEMRSAAKAVNFGIIYGIGAFSLSKDINVSIYEAKKYIENYLAGFPNVKKFMDDTVEKAKTRGYVTTMFGRRRYIPELTASNKIQQAAGKRIAMNTPIQGSAADIIKIAMVKVYDRLKAEVPEAKLILQVHDELIVECSMEDKDKAAKILSEEMQNAVKLSVPLTADVNSGDTWYEAKG